MNTLLQGRVLSKFGDSVSTDDMIQQKHTTSNKPEDWAKVCMHDLDPDFPRKMAPGGFLIAGKDFGCGSSRERAPVALKAAGVKAILAEEFARIFYRNALNICLPVIECPGVLKLIELGDELTIDLTSGTIRNLTKGNIVQGIPIPGFLLEMMKAGGLIALLKQQLREGR